MTQTLHPIIFVGAGPGDPELITVKGMKALQGADLIVYAGSLVPEALLCWKNDSATAVSSARLDLDQIIKAMSDAVALGKKVVRLHTGDPALYGAILEQMKALDALGIAYEIIPGVTAAFAAAAAIQMEYTLPEVTQTLILTRMAGRTPVPESEDLDRLAAHQSSMAIYLSIGLVEKVQKTLMTHYGEKSLCAIAYKVSHPEQRLIYTTIEQLASTCKEEGITRHALILVGKAVEAAKMNPELMKSKLYDPVFSHGYRNSKES